jgi:glycerol-3-phosphate acyltransferase PlsY
MKVLLLVFAYLLGAVPFGYLLFRRSEKRDIRSYGSQSTGATNVLRLKGWRYAIPVAVFDILKGAVPPLLALRLFGDFDLALACALAVVLGHCFPVYIKFRGGKGVAATVGAYAVLGLKPLLLSLIVFVLVIVMTRFVSLGSLLAALSFPPLVLFFREPRKLALLGLIIFGLIFFKHWGNLKRLLAGRERKFGERTSL